MKVTAIAVQQKKKYNSNNDITKKEVVFKLMKKGSLRLQISRRSGRAHGKKDTPIIISQQKTTLNRCYK